MLPRFEPPAEQSPLDPIEVYEEDGKVVKRYPPRWAVGASSETVVRPTGWKETEGE